MIPWRSAMLLLVVGVLIEFNWDSQLDSITCILRQCNKKYEVMAHSKHFLIIFNKNWRRLSVNDMKDKMIWRSRGSSLMRLRWITLASIFVILHFNKVLNPGWPRANHLAIYKHGRGFEQGTTMNKSSKRSERNSNSRPPNCKANALTTRPRSR